MSVELDILNEVASLLKDWKSGRLSSNVFLGENLDDYLKLPEWALISTEPSETINFSVASHLRVIPVTINYYRKKDGVWDYQYLTELKEEIYTRLPMSNDYWHEWSIDYDENGTDLDDEYEGFILTIRFVKGQSHICSAVSGDFIVTNNGYFLTTEAGEKLITEG